MIFRTVSSNVTFTNITKSEIYAIFSLATIRLAIFRFEMFAKTVISDIFVITFVVTTGSWDASLIRTIEMGIFLEKFQGM